MEHSKSDGPSPHKVLPWKDLSLANKGFLALALLFHLSLVSLWPASLWTHFTFDSAATRGQRGWDFYALYQAGHNVLTGVSAYESDGAKIEVVVPPFTGYRYLPLTAYTLGALFNLLSPLAAFTVWVLLVESVLLFCAYYSWRLEFDSRRGIILGVFWLCFTPYFLESYLGQFSLVQSALILLMMAATLQPSLKWRYDLSWVASLLWKQNTGLFIPVLLRQRRWRALAVALLAILLTSLPYFVLFPEALRAFWLGNFQSTLPNPQLGNLGIRQFLYSLVSTIAPSLSPETHATLQQLWVLAVLVTALWLTLSREALQENPADVALLLCLWTTTYFLVYHQVWEHHYVFLLPVYVLLYKRTHSWVVLLLYILVALWTPYILIDPRGMAGYHMPIRWTPLQPPMLDIGYHACKALPTLFLWAYIVRLLLRKRAVAAQMGSRVEAS
jgi:hypothetical protein